jgi:hypothetical protein
MVALVSVETVLLVLLIVLVAGLLRSHAELLRRIGPREEAASPVPDPTAEARFSAGGGAPDLAGVTPGGDAVKLAFADGSPTLLAFLTSGCGACARFWETLDHRRLPTGIRALIVTRGADRESPGRLRSLAPEGVPVVMSSAAWKDYRVPGAPYFVLVDGTVRGEGVATTWDALTSLVSDATEDQRASAGTRRARQVDEVLAAGGIGPDHPSLYPGR